MGEPSPLRNPRERGSACVEVMTTLHGNTPGGYQIEYIWAIFLHTYQLIHTESLSYRTLSSVSILVGEFTVTSLDSPSWIRVGGRLTRASDQLDQRSDQGDMDSQIVTVDQFAAAMASIQEAIASLGQRIDGRRVPVAPPPTIMPTPISEDPHARMDKLERTVEADEDLRGAITWEDFDGAPVAIYRPNSGCHEIERYRHRMPSHPFETL
ncbi:hypothetical protein AAG906_008055 [Vitis piasezkii]